MIQPILPARFSEEATLFDLVLRVVWTVSVRPPVRLSVTRVNSNKTNKSSADILIPCESSIHPTRRMVGGGPPILPELWTKLTPGFENGNLQSIFARTASALSRAGFTPSRAPVQKKCGGPYYMNTPLQLPSPDTHSSHHRHFVEDPCCAFHSLIENFWGFCGAPFFGRTC